MPKGVMGLFYIMRKNKNKQKSKKQTHPVRIKTEGVSIEKTKAKKL